MQVAIAARNRQTERIEGPTRAQAVRMAATRTRFLTRAQVALAAGDGATAYNLDESAFDLEVDLRRYGFDPETGRPVR